LTDGRSDARLGGMWRKLSSPFRTLSKVIWKTVHQMHAADAQILAGSLAFTTVISLVPLLAVSMSVFMAYGGLESLLQKVEPFILQNFVEASGAEFSRALRRAIQQVHSGALGFWGVVGLLVASTKLFHDMERAVERVWQNKTRRSFVRRIVVYWLVMFLAPLAMAGALGLFGSKDLDLLWHIPKRTIALVFTFVAFATIYKFVPSRIVHFRSALISAAVATAGVGVLQEFYARIMKHLILFSKVYGSLAGVPLFLLWILSLWWIGLAGVALSAVLEDRRVERALK
jgi:membrane protein